MICFISSDGHASARMEDYREYLEKRYLEEFDEFLVEYRRHGSRNFDPPALLRRTDPEVVDDWKVNMLDSGRADGCWNPQVRLQELEREGITAEVLFPDFGLPFEMYSVALAAALGHPPRTDDQMGAGNRAYNRWLADFCLAAPDRFAPMAAISWNDPEVAVREICWAKDAGFRGIVMPQFNPLFPMYHERFEPIWQVLEELELVVNCHQALSGTSNIPIHVEAAPPQSASRIYFNQSTFFTHDALSHLVWGGVLERHPRLSVVFTETGSSWVVGALLEMDYAYEFSYLRRDVRDVVKMKPSGYFERQCFLGSSIFSLAEVQARHQIGLGKIMIGADYPHHEGTLIHGTRGIFASHIWRSSSTGGRSVSNVRRHRGHCIRF